MSTRVAEWVWWVEDDSILLGYYDESKTDEEKVASPDSTIAGQELRLFFNLKEDHFDLPSGNQGIVTLDSRSISSTLRLLGLLLLGSILQEKIFYEAYVSFHFIHDIANLAYL